MIALTTELSFCLLEVPAVAVDGGGDATGAGVAAACNCEEGDSALPPVTESSSDGARCRVAAACDIRRDSRGSWRCGGASGGGRGPSGAAVSSTRGAAGAIGCDGAGVAHSGPSCTLTSPLATSGTGTAATGGDGGASTSGLGTSAGETAASDDPDEGSISPTWLLASAGAAGLPAASSCNPSDSAASPATSAVDAGLITFGCCNCGCGVLPLPNTPGLVPPHVRWPIVCLCLAGRGWSSGAATGLGGAALAAGAGAATGAGGFGGRATTRGLGLGAAAVLFRSAVGHTLVPSDAPWLLVCTLHLTMQQDRSSTATDCPARTGSHVPKRSSSLPYAMSSSDSAVSSDLLRVRPIVAPAGPPAPALVFDSAALRAGLSAPVAPRPK